MKVNAARKCQCIQTCTVVFTTSHPLVYRSFHPSLSFSPSLFTLWFPFFAPTYTSLYPHTLTPHTLTPSLPYTLTPSHTYSLTPSHSLPHSLTPSHPHSFTHSLPHTLTLTPSLSYTLAPSLFHTLNPSRPHSLISLHPHTLVPSLDPPHTLHSLLNVPSHPHTLPPSHPHALTPSCPHSIPLIPSLPFTCTLTPSHPPSLTPSPLPVWLTTQQLQSSVAFLPVNPSLSPLRNQTRQKLATLDATEFSALVIDILLDTKRRQMIWKDSSEGGEGREGGREAWERASNSCIPPLLQLCTQTLEVPQSKGVWVY